MRPVSNIIASFITRMTKPDAIEPIIALEATVVTGRTLQAYKRGGKDEARERVIEEVNGSIVWLCGVKVLNDIGDKIIANILKTKDKFDVGTDKVLRTPFDNFMKKISAKGFSGTQVAMMKGAKVLSSILLANLFIGFVVPKINHALTNKIHNKNQQTLQNNQDTLDIKNNEQSAIAVPAFKGGGVYAINAFTNIIENTNTGKLLSTDIGVAGGRMINARNKEERREIAIRDIGSIYFYMWAQEHVRNLLNLAETGQANRLNPSTADILTQHLSEYIKDSEMNVTEFRKAVLGKSVSEIKLPEGIKYEKTELSWWTKLLNNFRKNKKEPLQVAKVSELEQIIKDENVMRRIKGLSELQPKKLGESVITKEQLIDAFNNAKINDAEFLKKVYKEYTSGISTEEYRYISNGKLVKQKKLMESYVDRLCKKSKDGKISKKYIEEFNRKNTLMSGLNFAGGFAVAALFLSTIIPKIQYWVTAKTTGKNEFPGTYDEKTLEEVEKTVKLQNKSLGMGLAKEKNIDFNLS